VEASFISNRLHEHGILLGVDGPYHNVVKIRPPMRIFCWKPLKRF
jgi:4-aminobutyrate aminotransferase-like enzyme